MTIGSMFVVASALLASCRAATPERGAIAAELPTAAPVDVVRVLPAPNYERPIGEPVEMSPIEVAKTGRWVAACLGARTASEHAYLFRGGGAGMPYDELIAVSNDDRWLVLRRAREVVLIDDARGVERTLWRAEMAEHASYRRAAFDADSRYLVYLTGPSTLAVRSLADRERGRPPRERHRGRPRANGVSYEELAFQLADFQSHREMALP